jgi:hypothetical protein
MRSPRVINNRADETLRASIHRALFQVAGRRKIVEMRRRRNTPLYVSVALRSGVG